MSTSITSYLLSSQTSSLGGLFTLTPVNSLSSPAAASQSSPLNSIIAQEQVQISGYAQLLSALSSFQFTLQSMELPNAVTQNLGSSSNSTVATATTSTGAIPSTYNIAVTGLAQSQSVQSAGLADPNNTIVGSGTINIQLGTYSSGSNTFTPGSSPSVAVSINGGSLNSVASSINGANAGVSATVVQDAGGYHLLVSSSNPGTSNSLSMTVTGDSAGSNTDMLGLSQLAYDPTAGVGTGKNMTQVQAATNAAYTVNGAAGISTTNTGISLAQGVSLNLLQTGNSTITVGADYGGLQTSAQNFITAYNTLQSTVANLSGTSGPLAYDSLSSQLISDLNQTAQGSYSNGSSLLTMLSQIGVNFQFGNAGTAGTNFMSGGTLTLNANTLQNAFNSDSTGTTSLLSQAIQGFDTLAQQYDAPGYGSITSTSQSLQQLSRAAQNLSLGQSFFNPANNLPSISDLLAAQPATGSGAGYTAQQIQAIQQYAQVATLSQGYSLDAALISYMFGNGSSAPISTFA